MNSPESATNEELLLRDLVDGLSAPGPDAAFSIGVVGRAGQTPEPPAHCQLACLGPDPAAIASRGCRFLQAAARNQVDAGGLSGGRCPRGLDVSAQTTTLGGEPATLVTVASNSEFRIQSSELAHPAGRTLEAQLDAAGRLVQRVGQMLAENAGFANEVLQSYEQLNLIFELTQQIAQVTDARTIERILLQRVARLLASDGVWLLSATGECREYGAGNSEVSIQTPQAKRSANSESIDAIRRTRQVRVVTLGDRQVILGPLVRLDDQVDVVLAERAPGRAAFSAGDMLLVESVLAFGGQIISNTELHERMHRMLLEVTRALVAAIDKKDHYTSGHSERGGFLTRLTARELGVLPAQQQIMEWAGLLHDVGKIGIPEEILCKPGKLTPEEFEIVKQHPRMGYEILQPIASLSVILDGVLYHHEYPDGSGYPEGLRGDQIPLVARIVHVVDMFDALTSNRSYRRAYSPEQAIAIIRAEKGRQVDAEVAEAFIRAFESYQCSDPADYAVRFAGLVEREDDHAGS